MQNMCSAYAGSNRWIFGLSHSPDPHSKRSETYVSSSSSLAGPIGRTSVSALIHASCHTLAEFPSPIAFPRLGAIRSRAWIIPRHPWEQAVVGLTVRKEALWQYLPRKTWDRRQSGLVRTRHDCLARSALLKSWMSRNPNPPIFFGFESLVQDVQHILFLLSLPSHQKRVMADWILLQRLTGSSKQDIAWVGEANRTDFSIVILTAFDKKRLDKLLACCLIMSTIEVKRSFFLRPKCSGRPRYFPTPPSLAIPRRDLTLPWVSWVVFAEKVIDDLLVLIVWPDAASYYWSIECKELQLNSSDCKKNIVSYANRKWLTRGEPLATRIPDKRPACCALRHKPDSTSLHRINR